MKDNKGVTKMDITIFGTTRGTLRYLLREIVAKVWEHDTTETWAHFRNQTEETDTLFDGLSTMIEQINANTARIERIVERHAETAERLVEARASIRTLSAITNTHRARIASMQIEMDRRGAGIAEPTYQTQIDLLSERVGRLEYTLEAIAGELSAIHALMDDSAPDECED